VCVARQLARRARWLVEAEVAVEVLPRWLVGWCCDSKLVTPGADWVAECRVHDFDKRTI
jgi:hypothetical protein